MKPKLTLKLSDFVLSSNGAIWMNIIYEAARENKKLKIPEIKSILEGKVPRSYFAKDIDPFLISNYGEEITLLGIWAFEKNTGIFDKCNTILKAIQDILVTNRNLEPVKHTDIALHTCLPENEVSLLLLLMGRYMLSLNGSGSRTPGLYGYEFITFDLASYQEIMATDSIEEMLSAHVKRVEESTKSTSKNILKSVNSNATLIKWAGQRNQAYVLFQSLKEMNLIQSTNEDIAAVLKHSFDVFHSTSVSTIERELGRKHDLPKNRRLDVIKMLSKEDTV